MATVRIYKVAELLNTSSQEVIALLKRDHGIEVKSASSTIEEVVARQFVERLARQRNISVPSNASFADNAPAAKGRKPGKAPEPARPAAPALPPPRLVKTAKPAAPPPAEPLIAPPAAAEAVLVPPPVAEVPPPPAPEPEPIAAGDAWRDAYGRRPQPDDARGVDRRSSEAAARHSSAPRQQRT